MTVYRETEVPGTIKTWYAARRVVLENPPSGVPVAHFEEVERTGLNGAVIRERGTGRRLSVAVQEPGILIPYINPETYEQILDANGNPIDGQCFTDEQFAYFVACAYIYAARRADQHLDEEVI